MLAGERRDHHKEMIDDINDVDFISGLERAQFESINLDFDEFRVTYHDLRNYLYYTIFLHQKDEADYTGVESYIDEMLSKRDPGFFPTLRSAVLEVPPPPSLHLPAARRHPVPPPPSLPHDLTTSRPHELPLCRCLCCLSLLVPETTISTEIDAHACSLFSFRVHLHHAARPYLLRKGRGRDGRV